MSQLELPFTQPTNKFHTIVVPVFDFSYGMLGLTEDIAYCIENHMYADLIPQELLSFYRPLVLDMRTMSFTKLKACSPAFNEEVSRALKTRADYILIKFKETK